MLGAASAVTDGSEEETMPDVPSLAELLKDSPRNWGKWGPDDEVGCLNYLTPEVVASAVSSARQGKVFTLQVPMANPEGDPVWPGRVAAQRFNTVDKGQVLAGKAQEFPGGLEGADDFMVCYLQGSTQYDALGHVWYGDQIWNGYDAKSTIGGLAKASVFSLANKGIVSRGVLVDI